jgi:2-C-methyl-D-erythritol 4-phosphate cytidylyltransferase
MPDKTKYAILVSGGLGKRMQTHLPKQFLEVAGKAVLIHTFERFHSWDKNIKFILVLPEQYFETWHKIVQEQNFQIPHLLVAGGKERFFSVKNGLDKIDTDGLVAIHDGVRPLVHHDVINNAFKIAQSLGNAIPAIGLKESVRLISKEENKAFDRAKIKIIQTPQVFEISKIKQAYQQAFQSSFTDDASVLEAMGWKINLIEGNPENIKITQALDLKIAELFLNNHF